MRVLPSRYLSHPRPLGDVQVEGDVVPGPSHGQQPMRLQRDVEVRRFHEHDRGIIGEFTEEYVSRMESRTPQAAPALLTLASNEAQVWQASPYYEHAETWTWLFWSEAHAFRPLFDQLDLTRVLELACGHGRHAEHLLAHYGSRVGSLVMMDILQSNVDYCNARLGPRDNVRVLVNNGTDFRPMQQSSLTSIFCYDAMVHFDRRVIQSYLADAARVLVPGGKALFHHSNYGLDPDSQFGTNPQARAFMSKELFASYAQHSGLSVLGQTVMDWGGESRLDCLTLLAKLDK